VRIVPRRGSVTVFPLQRMTPAPNRNESRHLPRFLNLGNPRRLPFRFPFPDLTKSLRARSRSRNASWQAHLLFSLHHAKAGSVFFSAFHSLCSPAAEYHFRSASYRSAHLARPQFHANRAAPACERQPRSSRGRRSSAYLYACTVFTGRPL
jgi:hypothetical protein